MSGGREFQCLVLRRAEGTVGCREDVDLRERDVVAMWTKLERS